MVHNPSSTVRLKVSPEVAEIVEAGASRDVQLAAARGALPLAEKDLLTTLFFLIYGQDTEIRRTAAGTFKKLPIAFLKTHIADLHPKLLDLVARLRTSAAELTAEIIRHPDVLDSTLLYLARKGTGQTLEQLASNPAKLESCLGLRAEILANPLVTLPLKTRLGWEEPLNDGGKSNQPAGTAQSAGLENSEGDDADSGNADNFDHVEAMIEDGELSKYQMSLKLKVAEKIKMGLTGDKEWRSLLIKDSNKLVQGAVMKNPRITDGEVIMVAKNKQSSDEMIRLILLNKDWMKLYEIKKALVWHPKTPLPKALRLVGFLTLKDLKDLVRSRSVQTAISTAARKEVERKQKRI